jgi:lipopolysaccharide transport system permease protein
MILLQLLNYLTPIFYPKEALSDRVRILISMNPLTSYADILRHVFNGTEIATRFDWLYMLGSSCLIFCVGLALFNKFWPKTIVMI